MRHLETLLLFSPELGTEARDAVIATLSSIIEKATGTIKEIDNWGMKTLAYPVRKQTRGVYVRMDYTAPGTVVAELERTIRITEGIFKFLTVRIEERSQKKALKRRMARKSAEYTESAGASSENATQEESVQDIPTQEV